MVQSRTIHNSEVYLVGGKAFPAIPPPSPPFSDSPVTPTEECASPDDLQLDELFGDRDARLSGAVHVLETEATALQRLAQLYATDHVARDGFSRVIELITQRQRRGGKLVLIGVGKSGHICKKLVATFNSLALQAVFLHPTEALHGDLGIISPRDTALFITFSGKTPELLQLLPHIDPSLPLVLLTSHTRPDTCEMTRTRPDIVLLPAPIHEPEAESHGVSAPTTSTTIALALGDAVALVAAKEMHHSVANVFAKNHPGGAIGAAFQQKPSKTQRPGSEQLVRKLAVPMSDMGHLDASSDDTLRAADVLRAGYVAPSGWVRVDEGVVSPSRIRQLQSEELMSRIAEVPGLVTPRTEFLSIAADTTVRNAAEWVRRLVELGHGGRGKDAIVAVMQLGECVGLLELRVLLDKVC